MCFLGLVLDDLGRFIDTCSQPQVQKLSRHEVPNSPGVKETYVADNKLWKWKRQNDTKENMKGGY